MSDADYAILGSITVRSVPGDGPIALSEQHKLLLGRLLLVPGARVTTDALIEALWGDNPGTNPRNAVQVTVSAVRHLLGDTGRTRRVLVTDGDAYRLVVDDALRIDAERFRRLAERGHELAAARPRAARTMLSEALATWRGQLFGELGDRPWAIGHARELASLRDRAEVDLNEVRLALAEYAELESALRLQIAEHPHDERRHGQLVRTLDGSGRSAEAQIAYRDAYRELGAVGPELQRIGESVVRHASAAAALEAGAGRAPALYGGGRADGVLMCAVLDLREQAPADPGLGMLSLLATRHGGEAYPVADDLLNATFGDVESALRAAGAIASTWRSRARVAVHVGGVVRLGDALDRSRTGTAAGSWRWPRIPGQVLVSATRALAGSGRHGAARPRGATVLRPRAG